MTMWDRYSAAKTMEEPRDPQVAPLPQPWIWYKLRAGDRTQRHTTPPSAARFCVYGSIVSLT